MGAMWRRQGWFLPAWMARYVMQSSAEVFLASHASGAWPAANLALYFPVELPCSIIQTVWWQNGSAVAGNVDCGIYDAEGNRLVSTGSTAQTGTNAVQSVDVGPVELDSGVYWFALACSSGSATMFRLSGGATADFLAWGALQQGSAFPLPALASFSVNTTHYLPTAGFTGMSLL